LTDHLGLGTYFYEKKKKKFFCDERKIIVTVTECDSYNINTYKNKR